MEKSRIRLRHWIEHNADHLRGYEEVAETLENEGANEAAQLIRKGVELMTRADEELEKAVMLLPAPDAADGKSEAPHSHEHTHAHTHSHTHDHSHDHSHNDDHD